MLFPFEEWLGFVPVFMITAFFEVSEPVEGAFLPFLFSFASCLSDCVGSLVPGMGFSTHVLFDLAESSWFQSLKLMCKTELSSSKLSEVVAFANCSSSSILIVK